ncbi:MAG: GreA/GreB family elongation factor [Clostridia bacterium]|nr:GreA/GreB family elongation factor [Deltaproteobacteria bacterium]
MSHKRYFIEQLKERYSEILGVARRAEVDARDAAMTMQTESEKKEDARAAIEFGSLAKGQALRMRRAHEEMEILGKFAQREIPAFNQKSGIAMGAMVDVSVDNDEGDFEERTLILLPVGAGTELTGPGGDGFISVITPWSPIGKNLLGKRAGDVIDVTIDGELREWTIVDVS